MASGLANGRAFFQLTVQGQCIQMVRYQLNNLTLSRLLVPQALPVRPLTCERAAPTPQSPLPP